MQFGLATLPTDLGIRPDRLASAAEERGFESLWFGDHSLADELGRDTDGFEVTIYGAATDAAGLDDLIELGVHRAVFVIGATDDARTLKYLDKLAALIERHCT